MGFFSGSKSTSTSTSGWESAAPWVKQYTHSNLFPAITGQFEQNQNVPDYADYVAGLTPEQQSVIGTLTSGQPLGGGGMIQALSELKGMSPNAGVSPYAGGFLQQAGTGLQRGMSDITPEEVQGFANPYASGLKDAITSEGGKLQAQARAALARRGGGSFGDTSYGTRMGEVDTGILNQKANIDYNVFKDALAAVQEGRGRNLTGAATGGNLATQAQDVTNSQFNNNMSRLNAMANVGDRMTSQNLARISAAGAAGDKLQAQNQTVLDAQLRSKLEQQGFRGKQIDDLIRRLSFFQSGIDTSTNKSGGLGRSLLEAAASNWAQE